jgi:hypothetical protein
MIHRLRALIGKTGRSRLAAWLPTATDMPSACAQDRRHDNACCNLLLGEVVAQPRRSDGSAFVERVRQSQDLRRQPGPRCDTHGDRRLDPGRLCARGRAGTGLLHTLGIDSFPARRAPQDAGRRNGTPRALAVPTRDRCRPCFVQAGRTTVHTSCRRPAEPNPAVIRLPRIAGLCVRRCGPARDRTTDGDRCVGRRHAVGGK